jgi:hypothetical protein
MALGILGAPMLVQAQGAYDYESVSYPASEADQIWAINQRGDVAGNGFVSPDDVPYVYDSKKRTFTPVTPVAGYDRTAVLGLADDGTLVGSVDDDGAAVRSGVIIDQKGTVTVFDHPDAAGLGQVFTVSYTQARGVNNKGLVTGFRGSAETPPQGFIYDAKTGTFTDIVPALFTLPQGINSRGDVVGGSTLVDADPCTGDNAVSVARGWLRTRDGTVTYFDVNGWVTRARAISDSGTIGGWAIDPVDPLDPFDDVAKGFVVELDGSQCQSIAIDDADLLQFPGAADTFVQGIKNSGEVTGGYEEIDPVTGELLLYGFIARPQKGGRR